MKAPAIERCVRSARDSGLRLSDVPPPAAPWQRGASATGLPRIEVDSRARYQVHLGFGGAFTEAAATVWQALPPAAQEQLLRDYFDPQHGHGYTLGRVHINSCDFSLGHYAHAEQPEDFALASFSIERDRRALLPFLRAAQRVAGRPLQLLASPWSPPAWMKTNGRMSHGGELRADCREAWARCFVRFIRAYEDEGVPIWGVTPQNEPMATQVWDSCLYSAEAERDFVRDHLGPTLQAAGLGHVRIVIWDHNRDQMVERARTILSDPAAARWVWGTGFHWYGPECFDHVQQVHDAWPDKHLLFTEGCQEGGPHAGEWTVGERYARNILADLNRWTVGWIDWNLLLDDTGGPNHVGNLCNAPILANRATGALQPQSGYWALGHFARFIRPGARRLGVVASAPVDATAFLGEDGRATIVAANPSDQALTLALAVDGASTPVEMPPRSMATWVVSGVGR